MLNAEEDCIDVIEQGKGILYIFIVDIVFIWGEEKGLGEDKEIVYMLLSRVREFFYSIYNFVEKESYIYIGCVK